MKTTYKTLAATFGALLLALLCAPGSKAQCGSYQTGGNRRRLVCPA
jgi:hypothetical protein